MFLFVNQVIEAGTKCKLCLVLRKLLALAIRYSQAKISQESIGLWLCGATHAEKGNKWGHFLLNCPQPFCELVLHRSGFKMDANYLFCFLPLPEKVRSKIKSYYGVTGNGQWKSQWCNLSGTSKAFAVVSLKILSKLEISGCDGWAIWWLTNWLWNCSQRAEVSETVRELSVRKGILGINFSKQF